jgi:hypothetical protein
MPDLLIDSILYGMNDRVSPRTLDRHVEGDTYKGPLAMAKNVDRSKGVWAPRGGETAVNAATLGGNVIGITAIGAIDNDKQFPSATENIIFATDEGSAQAYIYRMAPSATSPAAILVGKINDTGDASPPVTFTVNEKYVIVHNQEDAEVIDAAFTNGGNWTFTNASSAVSVTGDAWEFATKRLIGKYVSVKDGTNTWYHKLITNVAVSWPSGVRTIAVTLQSNYTGATVTTDNVNIIGMTSLVIPRPTYAPVTSIYGAAGSGSLSGVYQWCCTYGTSDGFESAPGPWTTEVTVSSQNVLVFDFESLGRTYNVHQQSCNIDRVHIYRRGGSLGANSQYVATHYIHKYSPDAVFGHLENTLLAAETGDIDLSTDEATAFPSIGIVRAYGMVEELIEYTSKVAGDKLHGATLTRNVAGIDGALGDGPAEIPRYSAVALASYYDNNADSTLTGRPLVDQVPEEPYGVYKSAMLGGRLVLAAYRSYGDTDLDAKARILFSRSDNWRYFSTAETDLSDTVRAGTRRLAADDWIYGLTPFGNGALIAQTSLVSYAISGASMDATRIESLGGIPGCTQMFSPTTGDGYLFWVQGNKVWMWDGDSTIVDISEPVATTFGTAAASTSMHGIYHDSCFYLFYTPGGGSAHTAYICWDFRYPVQTRVNAVAPSPTIGDGVPVSYAVVSYHGATAGRIYAGAALTGPVYNIHAIMGTWSASPYTYTGGGGTMELQTPDFAIGDGKHEGTLETYMVQSYADTSAASSSVTLTPYVDGVTQTTATITLTGNGVSMEYDRVAGPYRGNFLGAKLSIALSSMAATTLKRTIERFALGIGGGRERRKGV